MTIEELRYFVEAGKFGSFSAAAEKLHISPQGLSQGIRHLEQDLNALLFQRTATGVSLSEIGLQVYEHASKILESLDHIQSSVGEYRKNRIGRIRCALKPSRIGNKIEKHLEEFQKVSGIDIEISHFTNPKQRGKLLLSNKIDLLFDFKEVMPSNEGFTQQLIFHSYMWPILNSENPLTKKEALHWRDLEGLTIIAESENHMYVPVLKDNLRKYGIKPKFEFCFDAHYCMEVLSTSPGKIYLTTESAFRQYMGTHTKLKCKRIEDALYLKFSAFVRDGLSDNAVYQELIIYLREAMKDYSTFESLLRA